jgi:hypothetical protein
LGIMRVMTVKRLVAVVVVMTVVAVMTDKNSYTA